MAKKDEKSAAPPLQSNSRVGFDKFRNIGGIEFWEQGNLPELNEPEREYHTVKGHNLLRHDLIAWDVYEDVVMWWVLAKKNRYRYIFDELVPGEILRVGRINEINDVSTVELKKKKR